MSQKLLFYHFLAAQSGELAIFAGIFVGGRGIGNVAIEDFVDGAGEQFGKLIAVAAIVCHFNLVDGDVGLEFRIRCLADKEERWRYAVVFVLQKVGIVECLEYVGITGSVGIKQVADRLYGLL